MSIFKKIYSYFDSISNEIKLINLKASIICAIISFFLGIISWIIGGNISKIPIIYIFPRSALPLIFAYILWGVAFAFCGFIFGGIIFGCEKFKKSQAYKIGLFIVIMQIFTFCTYPVFFGALSPLITFILFLIAITFCVLGIVASIKVFSLWTICLIFNLLWLIYNCYVTLAFAFVN